MYSINVSKNIREKYFGRKSVSECAKALITYKFIHFYA